MKSKLAGLLASIDYHRHSLVWTLAIVLLVLAILFMVENFRVN